MALPVHEQVKYWSIATAVFLAIMWFLGDVILPFVLGAAVAYCLDPIADWLERLGLPRVGAVILITIAGLLIFVLLVLLIIPTMVAQIGALFAAAPKFATDVHAALIERFPSIQDETSTIRQSLSELG
ncbi:MAG: AI-2E family transporter, partial [Pseudomonadota bacterium]